MTANTATNTNERYRNTLLIVAWPKKGRTNCTADAARINTTFKPSEAWTPAFARRAKRARTTRVIPRVS